MPWLPAGNNAYRDIEAVDRQIVDDPFILAGGKVDQVYKTNGINPYSLTALPTVSVQEPLSGRAISHKA